MMGCRPGISGGIWCINSVGTMSRGETPILSDWPLIMRKPPLGGFKVSNVGARSISGVRVEGILERDRLIDRSGISVCHERL